MCSISISTVHELSSKDENLGRAGEKLERYLCAMQPPPVFRTLFHSGEHLNGVAIRNSTANVRKCGFE